MRFFRQINSVTIMAAFRMCVGCGGSLRIQITKLFIFTKIFIRESFPRIIIQSDLKKK